MLRAVPLARPLGAPALRVGGRVARRRFATEAPTPKKSKHILRKLVLYSTALTATFYVGSAFVAFQNQQYYDVFVEAVPLGSSVIQYAEEHDWDTLTLKKVFESGKDVVAYVQTLIGQQAVDQTSASSTKVKVEKAKDAGSSSATTMAEYYKESKDVVKNAASSLITTVHKSNEQILGKGSKAAAIARHQSVQFSEGVEELVRQAEAALVGKPTPKSSNTTSTQPAIGGPDGVPSPDNKAEELTVEAILAEKAAGKNVYDAVLPLGFEPPPGFTRPAPPKPKPAQEPVKAESAPPPLPLVAPAVSEFSASEPVIAQLATVIDDLASYLNSNPTAAEKARDILDTAQVDLKELAGRIEKVKEEERGKLEAQLDEQTREYTIKLLELEMESQDKLDSQEEDFRKFYDEEKIKFVKAHREKLNHELQTQSEIINERLKEEVIAQGIELQRRWIREIKVRVEQERGGRLAKLDELATNLKRLERVALDNSVYLDENLRIHALWSALRAVHHTVDAPVRKPFREELRVLRHIAVAREDPVVSAALATLESSEVPDIGVEPFADLASWFTTSVAPQVTSVALVPDQNAGVLSHLASHLFSTFKFRREGLVPGSDVLSVLARAEYHMNEKDLDSAARELNQLGGTAKVLLTDWLDAARKRLEVLQALEVVQAQATLASLLVAQQ